MGSAGLCLLDSVELDELRFPIKVYKQAISKNSEGAGRRRGSPGAHVEYGPFNSKIKVAYASDGTIFPASGVRGGESASPAEQYKIDKNGKKINLPLVYEVELLDGEKIVSITQPGGGYGFPYDREIERVKKDFVEGWISNSRAFNVYGVKLSNNGKVDYIKTKMKRKLLKKANKYEK